MIFLGFGHPAKFLIGESPLSRPQSPDFKWPLTREEKMEELDQVYPLYADTPQAPNIIAARDYHSKFPADQVVPETIVVFMDGRQIDESEISMHKGQPWCEVWMHNNEIAVQDNLLFSLREVSMIS